MGDSLKLSKDKRHKSSSSIAGAGLEGTRSERKLEIKGLIPEVGDYFAVAESRCDDLQEKIDLLKVLKRKKKLNKRSTTRVTDAPTLTDGAVPFISVRTQPKKKMSQQTTRLRRLDVAPNPARGYVDPATLEQHRMLGHVWGYGQKQRQNEYQPEQKQYQSTRPRRNCADGDGTCGPRNQPVAAAGVDGAYSNLQIYQEPLKELYQHQDANRKCIREDSKESIETGGADVERLKSPAPRAGSPGRMVQPTVRRRPKQPNKLRLQPQQQMQQQQQQISPRSKPEERPVVELFHKSRSSNSSPTPQPPVYSQPQTRMDDRPHYKPVDKTLDEVAASDELAGHTDPSAESFKKVRRKPRHHTYELPTVASQLKQTEVRFPRAGAVTNGSNIPFVVSKNTGPSFNIGVNVQQVLNGMKIQQPLNGIPLTIAHHMGLGHVSTYKTKKKLDKPSMNKSTINAITMGKRTLTLPSRRSISYNRLLSMYSCGDGMVPRFLRANARANDYLYTSLYDLQRTREEGERSEGSERGASERSERSAGSARAAGGRGGSNLRARRARQQLARDRRRRYIELSRLYDECHRLEQAQKGGVGNKETVRRYNEILRILRANKDLTQQDGQKESMLVKTSTNTTLVSSTADGERDSIQPPQMEEKLRAAGPTNRTISGGASKASVHDGRLPHYCSGENRVDTRKSLNLTFR